MLPPKKNQAAREEGVVKDDTKDDQEAEKQEPVEYKNVFEETIVQGKRKHYVPKGKQVVEDWLSENFEEKEGRKCPFTQVYSAYLELCIERNLTDAITEPGLGAILKTQFPIGFVVREESGLKGKIKDVARTSQKKAASGVSNKYKMKEVIHEAFEDLKDPSEGVMFNTLRKYIMGKVPALQLDLKPKLLLRGLEMGVYHGYVELIKGTGRAGRYRWYNPDRKEEEKPAKKKKKSAEDEEEGEKDEEPSAADSTQEEEAEKKEGDAEDGASDEKKKSQAKKKAKKRVKKAKKSKQIVHSQPGTIEETFPLAFTFMAEPKEARVHSIIKYIEKHYDVDAQPEKIMKVLDTGADKGYWHLVQGNNRTGVYQLAVDEFDPTDDDDLIGKIINAIMASVDPKTCSARALKEYLIEFHPDYKIADRPYLFKKALERAVNRGVLRQLTGIGASGTFLLVEPFVPSPVILAGKDSASDYEVESSDEEELVSKGTAGPQYDLSYFQDAYKPRPSKRRGMVRQVAKSGGFDKNAAYFDAQVKQETVRTAVPQKRKATAKPQRKSKPTPKKKPRYASSSEDEEEEEKDSSDNEEDSTYGSDAEKYVPRPSSSRGGRSRSAPAPTPSKKKPKKAAKSKAPKSKPTPKKGKEKAGKKSPAKKTPKKTSVKTQRKGGRRLRR